MNKRYIGKEKENRQNNESGDVFNKYYVNEGDTLYEIAKSNNIDINLLAQINGIISYDYLYPNQEIIIPKKDFKLYITTEGDTLQNVAQKANKTIDEIIKNNSAVYLMPEQLIIYKE